MSATNCPTREALLAYQLGTLSEDTAEALIDHLSTCPSCQVVLQAFDGADDPLVGRLRCAVGEDPYLEESQRREAVARARAAASGPSASGGEVPSMSSAEPAFGLELGEYRLLEKLGQGGMGAVYRALQTKLDRVVALKLLPEGRIGDDRAVARFEREMKAIGRLNHPNIVQAYDAREIEGTRFLAIEYVEGLDLSELVRHGGPLRIPDACELVRQAALGLQCAHEHGLVHRDVKPSNLMLTREGQVKVLDLGLARFQATEAPGEELTGTGQLMGTTEYMAPEQALDTHGVDIRADIYSLGCTLYKLLSGRAPFGGSEYDTPLKKAMGHARDPVPPIRQFRQDIPEPLVAVLDRMLAKDPAERFATPAEVADAVGPMAHDCDLSAVAAKAEGRPKPPVEKTRPPATTEDHLTLPKIDTRVSPATRRSRLLARIADRGWKPWQVALGLMLLVFGMGLAFGIVFYVATNKGTVKITLSDPEADVVVKVDGEMIEITGLNEPIVVDVKEHVLVVTGKDFETITKSFKVRRGENVILHVELVPKLLPGPEEFRILKGHTRPVTCVDITPDGKFVVSASEDGTVRVRELTTGKEVGRFEGHSAAVDCLDISPDGKRVLSEAGGILILWELETRREIRRINADPEGSAWLKVAFSPDGKRAVCNGTVKKHLGMFRVWDLTSGEELGQFTPGVWTTAVAFCPDGKHVLCGCWHGSIRLVKLDTMTEVRQLKRHKAAIVNIEFSRDGSRFVSGAWDNTAVVWDASDYKEIARLKYDEELITSAISADGRRVASGAKTGRPTQNASVYLRDADTGREIASHRRHTEGVRCVAFAKDDQYLVSGSDDKTICIWRLPEAKPGELAEEPQPPIGAVTPRAVLGDERSKHADAIICLAFGPNDKLLATGSPDKTAKIWDLTTRLLLHTLEGHGAQVRSVAFSPDGKILASAGNGEVILWDVSTGKEVWRVSPGGHWVISVAFSPDGKTLAAGGWGFPITLWNVAAGRVLKKLEGHRDIVWSVAFGPDGKTLASVSFDKTLKLWDVSTGQVRQTLEHGIRLNCVVFSRDGKTVASAGDVWSTSRGSVKLWDATTGQLLHTLGGHPKGIVSVAFSRDGSLLASGGMDGEVKVWDVSTGDERQTLQKHSGRVYLTFSSDGRTLATAAKDAVLRLWDVAD